MNIFLQIAVILLSLFLVWRIYTLIKHNPEMLSKESMTKSFSTMGILALILIGGVYILSQLL